LAQIRKGANMHIADCFKMEYRMVRQFLSTPDFIEGCSAKLVHKKDPVWNPTMDQISVLTPQIMEQLFFCKKSDLKDLELSNKLTYYDYPHRTLSGLPTDRDVKRVVAGKILLISTS
jgi:3-hydroxyisobutyryl-CoA hydrolase